MLSDQDTEDNKHTENKSEKPKASPILTLQNLGALIILAIVAVGSFVLIQTFRKHGQMSVIDSQAMDMSTMVPPKGALPVALATVAKESISGTVTYTGSAVAFEDEDIYPRIEGRIVDMPVYPGDKVHKGQLLVQLDAQNSEYLSRLNEARFDAQALEHDASIAKQDFKKNEFQLKAAEAAERAAQSGVVEATANVDYWTPEMERESDLLKKQVVSQQEYDSELAKQKEAVAKLEQSRAQLAQAQNLKFSAQSDLDSTMHHVGHRFAMSQEAGAKENSAQIIESYRRIVSSAEGVVTKRLVSPGVVVSPGMLILKVAHVNKMRLQAELANSDVDKIQLGAPVYYQTSDNSEEHRAQVTSIFPAADPSSRTFIVEALIDNIRSNENAGKASNLMDLGRYILLPGQYVVMRIDTGHATGLVIPSKAIVWREGKASVWKAVGGTSTGKKSYTCLMHPEINLPEPGKCPKCGMELVPRENSGKLSAQLVEVKLGLSNPDKTEILSGLSEGEQIVFEGQDDLEPGMALVAAEWSTHSPTKLPGPSEVH